MVNELRKWIGCTVRVRFSDENTFEKRGILEAFANSGITLRIEYEGQRQPDLFCIPFSAISFIKFANENDV